MLEQIAMGSLQQTATNHCLTVAEQQCITYFTESVQSKSSGPKKLKKNNFEVFWQYPCLIEYQCQIPLALK